jgi:hypothetical protein
MKPRRCRREGRPIGAREPVRTQWRRPVEPQRLRPVQPQRLQPRGAEPDEDLDDSDSDDGPGGY